MKVIHTALRQLQMQNILCRAITHKAAKIREKYPGVKGMDSIHLATSLYAKCDIFLTNDARLKQVSEVNVVLVDEL